MTGPTLRETAGETGRRIGAALAPVPLRDEPVYAETAGREFSGLTPENAMKWGCIHPEPGRWDFEDADRLVAFAETHAMAVHGHTLVWHRQLPPYICAGMGAPAMRSMLADHIGTLVDRYRGRVETWDVVNEAVRRRGGRLRRTLFHRTLGEEYVALAFYLAHEADPEARLFYNDFGAEALNGKSDAVYALLRRLRAAGVPVHGVGLQMHVDAARPPDPEGVRRNVARLAGLGLLVRVTEMDVRIRRLPGDLAARLDAQRAMYHALAAACLSVPACTSVTLWGVTDRHSWIDPAWGPDDPLLFDDGYRPKPAYFGVRDALRA